MSPLIRNVLLTFIAVLGVYEGALRLTAPRIDLGQDQFTTNIIRLENYVDHPEVGGTVIVGSSLAARIPGESLGSGLENLSQAGGSALTGLEVVAAVPHAPKYVLIEINVLDKGVEPAIAKQVLDWPEPQLRALFWFYRTAYRPINLLVKQVSTFVKKETRGPRTQRAPPNFKGLLAQRAHEFSKPPDNFLAPNIARMGDLIRMLQAKGTTVVFFEMPVDRSLVNAPHSRDVRHAVEAAFDRRHFCWLTLDHGEAWQTGDGIHLLRQDAASIGQRLINAPCIQSKPR